MFADTVKRHDESMRCSVQVAGLRVLVRERAHAPSQFTVQ